ncbi:Uncharacterized protein HZ326_8129 [Fusarium oxysporum f. sp. albedinis]|nr:Uncharacterized protein HZ326_8129 [Fusarium oxysporum f. sp. albedinis]
MRMSSRNSLVLHPSNDRPEWKLFRNKLQYSPLSPAAYQIPKPKANQARENVSCHVDSLSPSTSPAKTRPHSTYSRPSTLGFPSPTSLSAPIQSLSSFFHTIWDLWKSRPLK